MIDDYENIPYEMRNAKRWLLWKSIQNQDPTKKPRKVPFYTDGSMRSGELDGSNDMGMLSTLDDACNILQSGQYTGLGFALGSDGTGNYWQGVDLDEMSKNPELGYIQEELPGYTELSPSGDGWHSIGYGRKFDSLGSNKTGIEAYSSGRYFTVTGECSGISPPCCIADFVEQRLKPIHSKANGHESQTIEQDIETISPKTIACLRSALLFMRADDRELWQKNGHRLKGLGDIGRGLWMEWSSTSDKFDPSAESKTWESFKPTHTGYKAIFSEAQRMGWVNPSSKVEDSKPSEQKEQLEFELVQIKEIIANPVNIVWMIKGVLESGGVSLISGAYGSGKSFVAFDMAFCIATGLEWHGSKVMQSPVVVLAGEGHSGIGDRFEALTLHYETECPDNLYLSKHPARLTDRTNAAWVKQAVDAICPSAGLVIIDTLNRNFGEGDENSSRDMSAFINSVDDHFRESGKTVLIVHHTGHAEGGRARGSSVLPASCEGEFLISKNKADDGLTLECKKQKNAKKPDDMLFNFKVINLGREDEDGEDIVSLVLECKGELSMKAKYKKLGKNDALALQCLIDSLKTYGDEPFEYFKKTMLPENMPLQVVHCDHWRDLFYKRLNAGENTNRTTFYRSRDKLKILGISNDYDGFYWIV